MLTGIIFMDNIKSPDNSFDPGNNNSGRENKSYFEISLFPDQGNIKILIPYEMKYPIKLQ